MVVAGDGRTPTLSVVMPTYNNPQSLGVTLQSLARQTLARDLFEVVVVKDGCDLPYDAEEKAAAELGFRIASQPVRKGRSAARNRGIELSRGEILLFLDSDSFGVPDLLERHYNFHCGSKGPSVLIGKRYEIDWPDLQRLLAEGFIAPDQLSEGTGDIRFPDSLNDLDIAKLMETPWLFAFGHNVSASRDIVYDAGLFDESFGIRWGAEDSEFFYRIHLKTGRIPQAFAYDSAAACYHLPQYRDLIHFREEAHNTGELARKKHPTYEWEFINRSDYTEALPRRIRRYRDALAFCVATGSCHAARPWEPVSQLIEGFSRMRTLVIGLGTDEIEMSPGSMTADPSLPLSEHNLHILGVATSFSDAEFGAVINMGVWRFLNLPDLSVYVDETLRISRLSVLVFGPIAPVPAHIPCIDQVEYICRMLEPSFRITVDRIGEFSVVYLTKREPHQAYTMACSP